LARLQLLQLLTELSPQVAKPISVHKEDCERLIAAYHARPREQQQFSAMFVYRTTPLYYKLKVQAPVQFLTKTFIKHEPCVCVKELLDGGELGEIKRVNWIVTDWFRTQAYYDSGGWRATWAGEGGGVLLNQSPHQLDLFQWLFGLPTSVSAVVVAMGG
jgi:predicted dehydrogenase